jgi:hypothetical protein
VMKPLPPGLAELDGIEAGLMLLPPMLLVATTTVTSLGMKPRP